jgi:hypothetical protein
MMFHLSSISNDKEGVKTQEICYFPNKIAKSETLSMVHDLVGPFTIRTPAKEHSLLALTLMDPEIHHSLV